MAITTRTQKGSALTIDEMDLNFLSTWEIITGISTNSTSVSFNAGPQIEVAYQYATRFNVMAFQIVGSCSAPVLWYPNWILSRQNTTSTNAPSASFVNPGAGKVLGQSQSVFTSVNTNGTGFSAMGTNNTSTFAPRANYQVMLRAWGGHKSYEPWFHDISYYSSNAGPQRYGGGGRINNQNSYTSYRKAGVQLRTGNNGTVTFKGSLYLMGLRSGYGYDYPSFQRDNTGT